MDTGEIGPIDFQQIPNWTLVTEEVIYDEENDPEVLQAKLTELEKWKEYKVYEEVDDQGNEVVSTRWVLKKDSKGGKISTKARLVARGFEEDATQIKRDSPTITKENIRLICTLAVANKWKIHSIDIRSAYLQGLPVDRTIYLLPPEVN